MKHTFVLILVWTLLLVACQTPRDELDRPIPKDAKHLTIQEQTGTVHFTVPFRWRIARLPLPVDPSDSTHLSCYELTRVGTFEQPSLNITYEARQNMERSSQGKLNADRLSALRRFYAIVRTQPAGSVKLLDGRSIEVNECSYENPGYGCSHNLWAFIPEDGFITEISLESKNAVGIASNRASFMKLLRSYCIRGK